MIEHDYTVSTTVCLPKTLVDRIDSEAKRFRTKRAAIVALALAGVQPTFGDDVVLPFDKSKGKRESVAFSINKSVAERIERDSSRLGIGQSNFVQMILYGLKLNKVEYNTEKVKATFRIENKLVDFVQSYADKKEMTIDRAFSIALSNKKIA